LLTEAISFPAFNYQSENPVEAQNKEEILKHFNQANHENKNDQ